MEDHAAVEAAVGRLRTLGSGRATLVDLDAVGSAALPPIPEDSGVLGRASDLVRCDDRYRRMAERLLGGVVVVEDGAAAARLALGSEGGVRFVSLDGEVWERGRVRAGSASSLSGLLHRETQIRELTGQLADLALSIEGLERDRENLEAQRLEAQAGRARADAELERRREALEVLARELEASSRERHWATSGASSSS